MSSGADAKPKATLPAGVDKNPVASLRSPSTKVDEKAMENVDAFMLKPRGGAEGFHQLEEGEESLKAAGPLKIINSQIYSKKKKPIAAFVSDPASEQMLFIFIRGDRSQEKNVCFKPDKATCLALSASLFATATANPCNLHPWFSSIVCSVVSNQTVASGMRSHHDAITCLANGKVEVCVLVPSPVSTETALHKLAIDKPMDKTSNDEADAHMKKWKDDIASKGIKNTPFPLFDVLVAATNRYKAPVEAVEDDGIDSTAKSTVPEEATGGGVQPPSEPKEPKAEGKKPKEPKEEPKKPKEPKRTRDDSDDDSEEERKPTKKEKRDSKYQRSGQCKFIYDSVGVSSRAEDRREEEEERKFRKRAKEEEDSEDDDDDDSDSEESRDKKKKRKRRERDSDEEDELESDSEEDSDDEDESDDDDDEEDSDEDATSSEEEEEEQPVKKQRKLVRANGRVVGDEEESAAPKTKQTTLNFGSAPSSEQNTDKPVRKACREPPARKQRSLIAAQGTDMLQQVTNCAGIPLSMTENVSKLTTSLSSGFDKYKSEKFTIDDSYVLIQDLISLNSLQSSINNATITKEDRSKDAEITRNLAVTTTSAMLTLWPALKKLNEDMAKSAEALHKVEGAFKGVSEDMTSLATTLPED